MSQTKDFDLPSIATYRRIHEKRAPTPRPKRPVPPDVPKKLILLLLVTVIITGLLWLIPEPDFQIRRIPLPPPFVKAAAPPADASADRSFLKKGAIPETLTPSLTKHIEQSLPYIFRNINPETNLASSLPGDARLHNWSVVYDNAMRVIMHVTLGQIKAARATIDYFIDNKAVQRYGWTYKNGKLVRRFGWIVNIIDAGEGRPGGRGVEHIAHAGPNIYLGIASVHLFEETGLKKYLEFSRERWKLLKDLQNENPNDFNYGGLRMGPLGNPDNPLEQRINFKRENPSFYDLYNGEHAADFMAFSNLMALIDPINRERYERAARLIAIWDKKIFDPNTNLFFIGTTEKPFFEENIGQWIPAGVMRIRPLDTTALKISAYGVKGLAAFGGAEKIRQAIDDNFKVTVAYRNKEGRMVKLTGYDFVDADMRNKMILFEEEGPYGDKKINKGRGRKALMTDEWSTWVALADLKLASDFDALGDKNLSEKYLAMYHANALVEGINSAVHLGAGEIAYPYAHPLRYSLNKPVGFGWNTHHEPYAVIGSVSRVLGVMRYDPFQPRGGALSMRTVIKPAPAQGSIGNDKGALYTEAELYLQEAWRYASAAKKRDRNEVMYWTSAVETIERMLNEHKDWTGIAVKQNKAAAASDDPYPLMGKDLITVRDLEPVFREYWALYHVGTGEFIRMMAYCHLAHAAKERKDFSSQRAYNRKAVESARRIKNNYSHAQAFDDNGWLWRPVESIREYVDMMDDSL